MAKKHNTCNGFGFDLEPTNDVNDSNRQRQLERENDIKKERARKRKVEQETLVTRDGLFGPQTKSLAEWKEIDRKDGSKRS